MTVVSKNTFEIVGGDKTFTILHNMNTRDLSVTIRNLGSKEAVMADVSFVDLNSIVVTFTDIVTAGMYSVTLMG